MSVDNMYISPSFAVECSYSFVEMYKVSGCLVEICRSVCRFVSMYCMSACQSDYRPEKNLLTLSSNADTVGLSQSVGQRN